MTNPPHLNKKRPSGLMATKPEVQRSMDLAKKEYEERKPGRREVTLSLAWQSVALTEQQQCSTAVRSMDLFKSSSSTFMLHQSLAP